MAEVFPFSGPKGPREKTRTETWEQSHVEFATLREAVTLNQGTHLVSGRKRRNKGLHLLSPLSLLLGFPLAEPPSRSLLSQPLAQRAGWGRGKAEAAGARGRCSGRRDLSFGLSCTAGLEPTVLSSRLVEPLPKLPDSGRVFPSCCRTVW